MDWEFQLIADYIVIEDLLQGLPDKKKCHNGLPYFSDAEVIATYFYGLRMGLRTISQMHNFASSMLREWFPNLPGYQQFNKRLNSLSETIEKLLCFVIVSSQDECQKSAIDSMPIIIAKSKRSSKASVANEIANKGYCASKDQYYYGAKLHLVIDAEKNRAPFKFRLCGITPASEHDINFLKANYSNLATTSLYGDKAYISSDLSEEMKKTGTQLITPDKKPRNGDLTLAQHFRNSFVSSTRQAIETAFSWIQEKTGLANASKVRSSTGLRRQIFGGLLAVAIGCV